MRRQGWRGDADGQSAPLSLRAGPEGQPCSSRCFRPGQSGQHDACDRRIPCRPRCKPCAVDFSDVPFFADPRHSPLQTAILGGVPGACGWRRHESAPEKVPAHRRPLRQVAGWMVPLVDRHDRILPEIVSDVARAHRGRIAPNPAPGASATHGAIHSSADCFAINMYALISIYAHILTTLKF